jgi:hypothetical protein
MGLLKLRCPTTDGGFDAGINTDEATFKRLPDTISTARCSHCGQEHSWRPTDARLRDALNDSGKHHIDPAQTEAMRSAFHKLCDALMLGCDGDDPMTEFIVTKIVALAKAGEHHASRLVELVLNDLTDDGLMAVSSSGAISSKVRRPSSGMVFAKRSHSST